MTSAPEQAIKVWVRNEKQIEEAIINGEDVENTRQVILGIMSFSLTF